MNVALLFALRAWALTLKQAPDTPVALPASGSGRSNSDEAAAIAAGYEAQMAIANTVAGMYANNNATVAGIRDFATEKVAETKAHLNATGEQAIAEAGGPLMPASSNRVLLGSSNAGRKARRALNATHISDIKNATMTFYSEYLKNVTENMTNYSRNVTDYMHLALNKSWDLTWFANGTAKNTSGVANWTEIAVATAVDPHWGPLAVNATNQSLREVDRTRAFADAVDFKVQHAQMDVNEAMKSAKQAVLAAAAAQASANDALKQTEDNAIKIQAAASQSADALAKATTAKTSATQSAQLTR
jgi:hypothetical protein